MRRYGGAGSVVKRELVALALACRGACEVISCPWILKRILFFFFCLISHIGIRRRVFALLVFCLSCSLWISVSLFIYFVFVGLLTLQPGFLAEPFVVLLLTWRIDFQIRSWGLCCHSAESLEKVENLWCFPAC